MDLLFGRRKTPEELLRQNQRALNRAMRELDRERQKLETQEKKIIADIKKMAKQGQMVSSGGRGWGAGRGAQALREASSRQVSPPGRQCFRESGGKGELGSPPLGANRAASQEVIPEANLEE